jgi:hypothetical protein
MFPRGRNLSQAGDHRVPDYRSRSARFRIFVLVAALMTVLVAMNEARKPENWAWLWRGQPTPSPDHSPLNTRIHQEPEPEHPGAAERSPSHTDSTSEDAGTNPLRRTWQQVWESLSYDEKRELARLLRTARQGGNPSDKDSRVWEPLATNLDQKWNELLAVGGREALTYESELARERRRSALQELTDLELQWNGQLKPAFAAAGMPQDWTTDQRAALASTQPILDSIALEAVRDDTVWRAEERTAWFRLLETLQQSDAASLARQSVGRVGFVQIFRQAEEYRGKVVSVRGTARLAYRVAAPPNDLGIRDYCLFWVQPEDGSNRPIVVYALEPPAGFPELTTEQRKLHEQLDITGYFFKRWVYRAADGLNSVPLIVAAAPSWSPAAAAPPTAQDRLAAALGPFFWPAVAGGVASLVLLACGLAWLVQGRTSPVLADLRATAKATSNWDQLPATQSLEESLRHLDETAGQG